MPITYDSQKRIFKLDTKTSTYALLVYRENYLVHLYYGAKLPDDNLASLMYRGRFDSLSPVSYTHLDVYKRQASGPARCCSSQCISGPSPACPWGTCYTCR